MSRIVVKIGSNVLTRHDGNPDITAMSAVVDQIAALREKGHQVVLVSSGAVACGKNAVKTHKEPDPVAARQLFSAIGQIRLINLYSQFFSTYGIIVGQVLTQKENFSSRTAYLNQRSCMLTMLDNDVLPIVNENDTVALTELMFTDNDELSGLISTMVNADKLILLTNVDGIYDGSPSDSSSRLIETVEAGSNIDVYISASKSSCGRGGMSSKCNVAQKVASEGVEVYIANGNRNNIIFDLVERPSTVPHTFFRPSPRELSSVKRWIAHSGSFAKGVLVVNDDAARVLLEDRASSLLPVGVTAIEGEWEAGDIVIVRGADGKRIGLGKVNVGHEEARALIGKKGQHPLVHYDYLYIE